MCVCEGVIFYEWSTERVFLFEIVYPFFLHMGQSQTDEF